MTRTLAYYDSHASRVAAGYEDIDFTSFLSLVTRHVPTGSTILDIGCGSGRDAAWVLAQGYDVTASDGSVQMLRQAERLHPELRGRTVHLLLPGRMPFPDASFSCVMCWAVLMHLDGAQIPAAIREICRVLAPGGMLAYSVNTARPGLDEGGNDEHGRHFTCLTADAWERHHQQAGFQTISRLESEDVAGRAGVRWVTFLARLIPSRGARQD